MYGVMLVLVLVVTGGIIAFIGDRLGTKVGKKKLSLFGMRPRHTSILVTIITGIMITTMTFLVMSVVSQNVRTALFGMEKLQQKMVQTQQDLQVASKNLDKTRSDLEKTKKEYDNSKKELGLLREELSKSEAISQGLRAEQQSLRIRNNELANRNENLAKSNDSLRETNKKLDMDNTRLTDTNNNLRTGIEMIRERPIVYRVGELLATGTIVKTDNKEVAEKEIGGLISLANSKIITRLGNNTKSTVWIYPEQYHSAINDIIKSNSPTVVRLIVSANMVNGDPVLTKIETYPDRLVYKANSLIYQNYYNLDDNWTSDALIGDFLRGVNHAAVDKGILPNPLNGSVGVINGTQIMELEKIIGASKGRILLQAYAEDNTNIIQPLRLDITVKQ